MEYEINRQLFKERLNKLMKEKDVSQSDIARACGVARQSVQGWCCGKSFPRIDYIEIMANTLKVPKSVLLGWQTEEEHKIAVRAESFGTMLLYCTKMQKLSEKNQKLVYQLIDTLLEGEMHSEES